MAMAESNALIEAGLKSTGTSILCMLKSIMIVVLNFAGNCRWNDTCGKKSYPETMAIG